MPLNVRRFCLSGFWVLAGFVVYAAAQTAVTPSPSPANVPAVTSGDVMRDRISKAKAFIVVRNYNAAIYELESIRKESSDQAVHGVINLLLMNSYLEQGDHKRAQDLLNEFYAAQKTTKPNASTSYLAIAGTVVSGARSRVERYRSLGLNISDRTLPLEALNDLDRMRETLEIVITQSKEIGADKAKAADGMALLEEASNSRSMLARDEYDARRWKDEVADTREKLANSRTVVTSAVAETTSDGTLVAQNTKPAETPVVILPAAVTAPAITREREVKPPVSANTQNAQPAPVPSPSPVATETKSPAVVEVAAGLKADNTIDMGASLREFATLQPPPLYPALAKSTRTAGVVTVEVTIDEKGQVAKVEKTSGPQMLRGAAQDAIRKWKFKPFVRDGQAVKATGFVNFDFKL